MMMQGQPQPMMMQPGQPMMAQGMPTMQQPQVVYVQDPNSVCHILGCKEPAIFTCSANYCCKERGCNKRMCAQHKSKKCFQSESKHSPPPTVCVECEDAVKSCSNKLLAFPLSICAIVLTVHLCVWVIIPLASGGY